MTFASDGSNELPVAAEEVVRRRRLPGCPRTVMSRRMPSGLARTDAATQSSVPSLSTNFVASAGIADLSSSMTAGPLTYALTRASSEYSPIAWANDGSSESSGPLGVPIALKLAILPMANPNGPLLSDDPSVAQALGEDSDRKSTPLKSSP